MRSPDFVLLRTGSGILDFSGGKNSIADCTVQIVEKENNLKIGATSETTGLLFLQLRWNFDIPQGTTFCGDAFERTYGDLQWRTFDADCTMAWYFMMHNDAGFHAFGVRVRGGALAQWFADPRGVTLFLDLRSGAAPCYPKGRLIEAAEAVEKIYEKESFAEAQIAFCKELCNDPITPDFPVYGSNNWYYAYGKISHESVLEDCRVIAELCAGFPNRPFMVIDAGWADRRNGARHSGGDWAHGNARFRDMAQLAKEMRELGVRPGLWFSPLEETASEIPDAWYLKRPDAVNVLDVSVPEAQEWIKNSFRRIRDWGYELIKHDFSTYDIFGKWAFEARPLMATGNWSSADNSRTTAEWLVNFYRIAKEGANTALVLGCNTVGHLSAGLHELSRTGDDTSGKDWARSLKMGVNTLAFRIGQHRTFFELDADCIGITEQIPWEKNRQFAELVARSGTAFFASIKPGCLNADQKRELREVLKTASERPERLFPEDVMTSVTPSLWHNADGKKYAFDWYEKAGIVPEQIFTTSFQR